jgi:hypothetical protein
MTECQMYEGISLFSGASHSLIISLASSDQDDCLSSHSRGSAWIAGVLLSSSSASSAQSKSSHNDARGAIRGSNGTNAIALDAGDQSREPSVQN